MSKKKVLKSLGPVGQRMSNAVFHIDALAYTARTLALQGQCPPEFAEMLAAGAKENHAAALGVCESQGYEPPIQPAGGPPGGGKGSGDG